MITNSSISLNAEKSLIGKFRAEAGVAFVTKMASMIQDLEVSKSEMDIFKQQTHRGKTNGVEMNVQVLGNNTWEIEKTKFEKITITPIMRKCCEDFNTFYINRRKMHKLEWVLGVVSCIYIIIIL